MVKCVCFYLPLISKGTGVELPTANSARLASPLSNGKAYERRLAPAGGIVTTISFTLLRSGSDIAHNLQCLIQTAKGKSFDLSAPTTNRTSPILKEAGSCAAFVTERNFD